MGAGSAGFSAAITAADDGAKVALIGDGVIGGTCVNVGCVPSKALIRAVEITHQANASERFDGVTAHAQIKDWGAVIRQKQKLVDDLRTAKYIDVLPNYPNVTYISGAAELTAESKIMVNGLTLHADKIIIATGSRPMIPEIDGLETVNFLDSTSALQLVNLPKSMMIMGGGYIGVELAQIFSRAGVKVTIVTRHGLLPGGEPEISSALTQYFSDEGIKVIEGLFYNRVETQDDQVILNATKDAKTITISANKLLLATGRIPNSAALGLNNAGVKTDIRGAIQTNTKLQTDNPKIYAAGDVTGRDQFVYMAAYGAKIAAKNAFAGHNLEYDNETMPSVVFSDPQVASVGLTESQARGQGINVIISVLPLEHVPRALAARDTRGLIKLVADKSTKKLIGAHILAPEGADCIQTAVMALKAAMTYEDLGAMIFPYLTTVEGLKLASYD